MRELAQMLRCSLPTAQRLVEQYPDLPVLERGGLGKSWRFDGEAVIEFLQAKRAEEEAKDAERNEALAQLTLPIGRKSEAGAPISLDDEIKAAKLRQLQRDELREMRFLVQTAEVRTALEQALRRFGQMQASAVTRVCRAHNLPEAVQRALEREFMDVRSAFVRETEAALETDGADEPASLFG
ncbi:MAG TPA: helix-turn-helix domain-containing protein [Acidocella sp.]|uniref:helix-turn-helix domain-containing protein n=1 Tax=Acidocella sp. TaxID=50710 RepID=UPI002C2715B5|nr:helix-turn-helix domain-containing protein [Acidocella sp.]HVE20642.1 helix-turn-helix domain-containing protein [Acidocella sp.]